MIYSGFPDETNFLSLFIHYQLLIHSATKYTVVCALVLLSLEMEKVQFEAIRFTTTKKLGYIFSSVEIPW